jgi:hypothetical protein
VEAVKAAVVKRATLVNIFELESLEVRIVKRLNEAERGVFDWGMSEFLAGAYIQFRHTYFLI